MPWNGRILYNGLKSPELTFYWQNSKTEVSEEVRLRKLEEFGSYVEMAFLPFNSRNAVHIPTGNI